MVKALTASHRKMMRMVILIYLLITATTLSAQTGTIRSTVDTVAAAAALQDSTISGKVRDENGTALPGVTISAGATGRNEVFPIPAEQIQLSGGRLTPNPNF